MAKSPDLVGKKFNRLLVLSRREKEPGQDRTKWLCLCDCGNQTSVGTSQLVKLTTKSCGCARVDAAKTRFFDITGSRFGRLVVLRRAENKHRRVMWTCLCDCGKETTASQNNLSREVTTSCGCYGREVKSKNGKRNTYPESGLGRLFELYKKNAKRRKIPFELSWDQFRILTSRDCHYCGVEPSNKIQSIKAKVGYVWNGVDRKDNNDGYNVDNCLPCCSVCNRAKHVLDYDTFVSWMCRISNRFNLAA